MSESYPFVQPGEDAGRATGIYWGHSNFGGEKNFENVAESVSGFFANYD
jgi:hypothetical protein